MTPGGSKRNLRRGLVVGAGIALIGTSLVISREPLFLLALLFVLVVPFEKWMPRHPEQKIRRKELGTDMAHGIVAPLVAPLGVFVAVTIGALSLGWLPGLALRPLVSMLPGWASMILGVFLFDALIYWTHRFSHEVSFLWRFHAVHHSTETLDWVSGLRQHPFDGVILAPAFAFLLGAGFTGQYAGVLTVVQILTGIFLHANVRWRLRPLHKLIITPEFHHWHHTNEPKAIHSNYSVFLPIWDLIFGTYFMPSNRRPQTYGINEHMPAGVAAQMLWPLRGMGNPIRILVSSMRHPIRSVKWLARWIRTLMAEMKRTAFRPTKNVVGVVPHPPTPPVTSVRQADLVGSGS
ncbi:MAG: sterol desaturase family protein [Acidimicrobiales bacterium]|nr:sterol desaturase family protein [Acidimicrobiales bacterium]